MLLKKGFFLLFFYFFGFFSTYADLEVPQIQVVFQQPSYLVGKEIVSENYFCDTTHTECKVNFDISSSIPNGSTSLFGCYIDFGFSTTESEKCNPSTVVFPKGTQEVTFKIFEKINPANFQEKKITIVNERESLPETSTNSSGQVLDVSPNSIPSILMTLQNPSTIQKVSSGSNSESGSGEVEVYECDKDFGECKGNFSLEDTFGGYVPAKFACKNSFGFASGEEDKCNPNTLLFPEGENIVEFSIYEKAHPENKVYKKIKVINFPQKIPVPEPIITVQSGLTLQEEKYLCKTSQCTINFTAQETFTGTILEKNYDCRWVFDEDVGGEVSSCNPGYISFSQGFHKAILFITSKQSPYETKSSQIDFENTFSSSSSSTGETLTQALPEPHITLQNPSTIIQSGSLFICDETKQECKINISLEESFTSQSPSKYSCIVDFGFILFEDCNPNTISIPTGEIPLKITIYDKDFPENNVIKNYNISNISQKIEIPSPKISIQSGLTQGNNGLLCKNETCKVNFSGLESFSGGVIPEKISCEWDIGENLSFSGNILTSCNPGYITFSEGVHIVSLKLFEIGNPENKQISTVVFQTQGKSLQVASGGGNSQSSTINEPERNIIIQSGLLLTESGYMCEKQECKVNLTFHNHSFETCSWNFGDGQVQRLSKNTCNPGIVTFSSGKHTIFLLVTDQKTQNSFAYNLSFENTFSIVPEVYLSPSAKIQVQSKQTKNLHLENKRVICYTATECNINFSAEQSTSPERKNLDFLWDFGNGETSTKVNPKSVKYSYGKYSVTLNVSDGVTSSKDSYIVEVLKQGEVSEKYRNQNIQTHIKITALYPNPEGKDDNEWIEISNSSNEILNLKGAILKTAAEKKYVFEDDFFIFPYTSRRLYKKQTHVSLKNQQGEISFWYNNEQIDSLTWNFSVKTNTILYRESLIRQSQKVTIERVVDGDTLVLVFSDGSNEKLRLIGVDTPETKHPKKKVQEFGKEAYEFTKKSLEGKEVFLEIEKQNYRDKYGRLLGYIYLQQSEISFNQILIEKGYARAYLYFPFAYSETFKKAEAQAKKLKVGLWADKELIQETIPQEELLPVQEKQLSLKTLIDSYYNFQDYLLQAQVKMQKMNFKEKMLSFFHNPTLEKKKQVSKKKTTTLVEKKQKFPFSLSVSLLKSGIKVYGKTLPHTSLKIQIFSEIVEIESDEKGKYQYKYTGNMTIGEQKIEVSILGNEKQAVKSKEKSITLTSEYITQVLQKKQKALAALLKKKKKKTKKVKKIKPKTLQFFQAVGKNFEKKSQSTTSSQDIYVLAIFFIVGVSGAGQFLFSSLRNRRQEEA